jgi:hypothetical protein
MIAIRQPTRWLTAMVHRWIELEAGVEYAFKAVERLRR